jgi:hypothetical protein
LGDEAIGGETMALSNEQLATIEKTLEQATVKNRVRYPKVTDVLLETSDAGKLWQAHAPSDATRLVPGDFDKLLDALPTEEKDLKKLLETVLYYIAPNNEYRTKQGFEQGVQQLDTMDLKQFAEKILEDKAPNLSGEERTKLINKVAEKAGLTPTMRNDGKLQAAELIFVKEVRERYFNYK